MSDRDTHAAAAEAEGRRLLRKGWRGLVLPWEDPLWSTLLALAVYAALAVYRALMVDPASLWSVTRHGYFNYLADAFLHGQLHLRILPPTVHDLVLYQGHYYLYWPPLPAILLMPFVALFGVRFSDVWFTLAVGSLNVGLTAFLLRQACRRGVVSLSAVQRALLVLVFALGTVHVTLAPYGRVWFTAQVLAYLCVVLAFLAAISLRGPAAFALTGVAITGALLTRNHLVVVGLWPAVYLLVQHRSLGWRRLSVYAMVALLPVVVAVGLLGAYNWARFGDPLDNGLDYHLMGEFFASEYEQYGAFDLYYLGRNLFYQYVAYPFLPGADVYQGGSLFLLTPVFLAAFWGIAAGRPRWSAWTLLATVIGVATPILLLMGTGYVQFGPRYTLDFTVPLLLLTALGVPRWSERVLAALALVSVLHYLIGTAGFALI